MDEYQLLFTIQSIFYLLILFVAFAFSVILLAKKKNAAGVLMTVGSGIGLLINIYRQLSPYLSRSLGLDIGDDMIKQQVYIGFSSILFYAIFIAGVCALVINFSMPSKKQF